MNYGKQLSVGRIFGGNFLYECQGLCLVNYVKRKPVRRMRCFPMGCQDLCLVVSRIADIKRRGNQ